jgi:hypothetical protein
MKISVDGVDLFTIEEHQKKAMIHFLEGENFEEDMKRRIQWVITHKYEQCLKKMVDEWLPKLKERYDSIPSKDADLVDKITSESDYQPRQKDTSIEDKLKAMK